MQEYVVDDNCSMRCYDKRSHLADGFRCTPKVSDELWDRYKTEETGHAVARALSMSVFGGLHDDTYTIPMVHVWDTGSVMHLCADVDDEFAEEIIDKNIRNCVFEEEIRNTNNPNSDP